MHTWWSSGCWQNTYILSDSHWKVEFMHSIIGDSVCLRNYLITYLHIHSLTPCSWVLLEKLTSSQLVKKFHNEKVNVMSDMSSFVDCCRDSQWPAVNQHGPYWLVRIYSNTMLGKASQGIPCFLCWFQIWLQKCYITAQFWIWLSVLWWDTKVYQTPFV